MAQSTWTRDLRVLDAIRDLESQGSVAGSRDQVAAATGLDRADVNDAIIGLIGGGYVTGNDAGTMAERWDWMDLRLTGDGRRAVGQWPSADPGETLLRLLEERIATTADPDERSRLTKVLDALTDVGTGVISGVLSDLIRGNL